MFIRVCLGETYQNFVRWRGLSSKRENRKGFVPTETNLHGDALCFMVKTWTRQKTTHKTTLRLVAGGGWRLAAVGGGWLAVGGGWRLAVCGWWRLAVAVGGWLFLRGCP